MRGFKSLNSVVVAEGMATGTIGSEGRSSWLSLSKGRMVVVALVRARHERRLMPLMMRRMMVLWRWLKKWFF